MRPYIVTIARQYGSGGKTIGKMLANKLDIPYYNRDYRDGVRGQRHQCHALFFR